MTYPPPPEPPSNEDLPEHERPNPPKQDLTDPGIGTPVVGGPGDQPWNPYPETPGPTLYQLILEEMPWIPPELIDSYVTGYALYGDDRAWEYVRANDPDYDTFFRGNRRENGTFRYSEAQYMALIEEFREQIERTRINPDVFNESYWKLIEGGTSPNEFFADINALTERVNNTLPEIQAEFAEMWGYDLTPEGILAAAFDPAVGEAILNQQITMAEIAGEASFRQFDIDADLALRLFESEVTRDQAAQLFGNAQGAIPVLSALAARYADPDTTVDIDEFLDASVFDDPFQRQRIRRIMSQERASFSQTGALQILRDKMGGQQGLGER